MLQDCKPKECVVKQDNISITTFIKVEHNIQQKRKENMDRMWQRILNDHVINSNEDYDIHTYEISRLN